MDLGVLKGPAELLASKVKAFKNCLELATDCLTNKDYMNAEMIYGGILADLHKNCIVEALNLNDLDLFSLHSCFAYSSIGADYKSEQALVILNSIHKPIKLPLVPYLKAFVHISNDRLSFAHDELQSCQSLLNKGYNFKPNSILNEEIIPEINDDFLKLKINGLKFACELLKAKENNEDVKKCFKENWLKIGKLCETDFAKVSKKDKNDKQKENVEESHKETIEEKRERIRKAIQAHPTGAIKKTEKAHSSQSTTEMGIQTTACKTVHVAVQTMEKEMNKQLLSTVLDIRNKMNNMQSKKDNEIKQLQKKNSELTDKLLIRDTKRQEKTSEFDFLKEQFLSLERKYEQSQKQVELMQKILIEQLQQKYNMQKNIYQLFEEKCDYKIIYLSDIQKYLHPADRPTPDECKQEVSMWKSTLNNISVAKKDFEAYYRTIDDLIVAKKYSTIKTNDWPGIVTIPTDVQDIIYRNFKIIMQQSKSLYSMAFPNGSMFGNQIIHNRENDYHPNYFVNGYNAYKEDGRTTGSPNYQTKYNPSMPTMNGNKQYPFMVAHQSQYNGQRSQMSPQNMLNQPPPQNMLNQPPPQHMLNQPPPQSTLIQPPPQNHNIHFQPPPQNIQLQQTQINKKALSPTPTDSTSTYKLEQELLKFLQSNFKDLSEVELQEVTCHVRDNLNGGSLIGFPRKVLVEEIKKAIKKSAGAKSSWSSVSKTQWHNDHSDNKCCICFEDYDSNSSHSLPCQHEFHKKCITNWLKRQSACPVCRVHAVIDEEYPPLKV